MAGFTNSYENSVLDHSFGGVSFSPPTVWYIGLMVAAPTELGGSVVEPAGNGYLRVGVANNVTQWPAAVSGAKQNANAIVFPTATGNGWGTVTHFGFFDAISGGNLRAFAPLDTPRLVNAGDGFQFLAGDCKFTLD